MDDFLYIIGGIGFVKGELDGFPVYQYDKWTIFITEYEYGTTFTLTYHRDDSVSASHKDNPIGDFSLLEKYFKREIRELKLNELLDDY